MRSPIEVLAENAMLRQQLIIASRAVRRPEIRRHERDLLVLLASFVPRWRDAVLLVKPDTILRWRREGFRLLWRWRSRSRRWSLAEPPVPAEIVELIKRMARENRLFARTDSANDTQGSGAHVRGAPG